MALMQGRALACSEGAYLFRAFGVNEVSSIKKDFANVGVTKA